MVPRPAKTRTHRNQPVDSEFSNVYLHLSRLSMGPFRFYYDSSTNTLYLQYKSSGSSFYTSVLSIDSSGNLKTTGTQTPSTTISDVGR
jgi:hypothetical protein